MTRRFCEPSRVPRPIAWALLAIWVAAPLYWMFRLFGEVHWCWAVGMPMLVAGNFCIIPIGALRERVWRVSVEGSAVAVHYVDVAGPLEMPMKPIYVRFDDLPLTIVPPRRRSGWVRVWTARKRVLSSHRDLPVAEALSAKVTEELHRLKGIAEVIEANAISDPAPSA